MQNFNDLGLHPQILSNLEAKGYLNPTPIQEQSIPVLLKGADLFGIAQTGTGKTAAFSLPIIDYLINHPKRRNAKAPRVLILAPTRELSSQIKDNITDYSKELDLTSAVIFGGVGQASQVKALR
ncbi:MAG: DEAD/DEAH box helicase, partial [Bacteriovoracaceae bacterium]